MDGGQLLVAKWIFYDSNIQSPTYVLNKPNIMVRLYNFTIIGFNFQLILPYYVVLANSNELIMFLFKLLIIYL